MKKKILSLCLVAAMTVGVVGCGSKEDVVESTPVASVEESVEESVAEKSSVEESSESVESIAEVSEEPSEDSEIVEDSEDVKFEDAASEITVDVYDMAEGQEVPQEVQDNWTEYLRKMLKFYDAMIELGSTDIGYYGLESWWDYNECNDLAVDYINNNLNIYDEDCPGDYGVLDKLSVAIVKYIDAYVNLDEKNLNIDDVICNTTDEEICNHYENGGRFNDGIALVYYGYKRLAEILEEDPIDIELPFEPSFRPIIFDIDEFNYTTNGNEYHWAKSDTASDLFPTGTQYLYSYFNESEDGIRCLMWIFDNNNNLVEVTW